MLFVMSTRWRVEGVYNDRPVIQWPIKTNSPNLAIEFVKVLFRPFIKVDLVTWAAHDTRHDKPGHMRQEAMALKIAADEASTEKIDPFDVRPEMLSGLRPQSDADIIQFLYRSRNVKLNTWKGKRNTVGGLKT